MYSRSNDKGITGEGREGEERRGKGQSHKKWREEVGLEQGRGPRDP